jgi:hypothetical protein
MDQSEHCNEICLWSRQETVHNTGNNINNFLMAVVFFAEPKPFHDSLINSQKAGKRGRKVCILHDIYSKNKKPPVKAARYASIA